MLSRPPDTATASIGAASNGANRAIITANSSSDNGSGGAGDVRVPDKPGWVGGAATGRAITCI